MNKKDSIVLGTLMMIPVALSISIGLYVVNFPVDDDPWTDRKEVVEEKEPLAVMKPDLVVTNESCKCEYYGDYCRCETCDCTEEKPTPNYLQKK